MGSTKINDDPEVTSDSITTEVTLPESGISSCVIRANDDKGKSYLAQFHLYDNVTVKYSYNDTPDWSNETTVFFGKIIDLEPSLSRSGQVLSITVMNNGYCLKQMRVAQEYGSQSLHGSVNVYPFNETTLWVESFDNNTQQWIPYGDDPWLNPGDTSYLYAEPYLSSPIAKWFKYENLNNLLSYFGLSNSTQGTVSLESCTVVLRGLFEGAGNQVQVKCTVKVNGVEHDAGNVTFTNDAYDLVSGDVDISDIFTTINDFNDSSLKIQVIGYDGDNTTKVYVYEAWLDIKGTIVITGSNSLVSLRGILANATYGIIPAYVEKILNTNASQYTIGTDYIYDDNTVFTYINFPYQDAFMCIQDLVRLLSGMHYLSNPTNWSGLHWIVDNNDNLLIAPVGDHNVSGLNNSCIIENLWSSMAKDDNGDNLTLIVREDMVTQKFKKELPLANLILVAGKFITPQQDSWCQTKDKWSAWESVAGDGDENHTHDISLDSGIAGKASIKLVFNEHSTDYLSEMNLYRTIGVDLSKLLTYKSDLTFNFSYKQNSTTLTHTTNRHFRLYKDIHNYYEYNSFDGDIVNDNEWYEITTILRQKDMDAIANGTSTGWTKTGTLTLSEVVAIGVKFSWSQYSIPLDHLAIWIDDLGVVGNAIRGAMDSTSINGNATRNLPAYGCRTLTIKDSLASTDTIDANDFNSPLIQLALYELLRCRIVRTTGEITVPLRYNILPGQIVHIYTAYNETSYVIDGNFRITEVKHMFTTKGAVTSLKLTDDLYNSIPIDTNDPYTVAMRAVNPDYQTRTLASLKISGGDFDTMLQPIIIDYPS